VDIHVLNRSFWNRLDGSVDIGFNYTKASDVTQFNLAATSKYHGERWISSLALNSIITTQPERPQTRKQDLTFQLRRILKKNWYIFTIAALEQNTELGLDLRSLISLGGLKDIFQTNRNYLNVLAGISVNSEWSNDFTTQTSNLEAMAGFTFQKFKHITPKIDLSSFVITYPSLSNLGRVRLNMEVKGRFEVVSDLFIGITFYDNYDNRPAGENAARNDWGVIFSVGYTW
jgi:hypothetical protein